MWGKTSIFIGSPGSAGRSGPGWTYARRDRRGATHSHRTRRPAARAAATEGARRPPARPRARRPVRTNAAGHRDRPDQVADAADAQHQDADGAAATARPTSVAGAFEQRRLKGEGERDHVGDDAEPHPGPARFPEVGPRDRGRRVGRQAVRRRDEREHAEVEEEEVGRERVDSELGQPRTDQNRQRHVDHRRGQRHAEDDADDGGQHEQPEDVLPARLTRSNGSLDVKPDSCSAPMTSPASAVIAVRSSIVRPSPRPRSRSGRRSAASPAERAR